MIPHHIIHLLEIPYHQKLLAIMSLPVGSPDSTGLDWESRLNATNTDKEALGGQEGFFEYTKKLVLELSSTI